jgi:hypothetical protein
MINSIHIVKNIRALNLPTNLSLKIGVRYANRTIEAVDCKSDNLTNVVWQIIDNKHPVYLRNRDSDIKSIFVCNEFGKILYDSRSYTPDKNKLKLKKDGDRKVISFKFLSQEEKDKVVEGIVACLEGTPLKEQDNNKEQSWGDMPWDFQQ